jgi:preprotein translocase subunit SecG
MLETPIPVAKPQKQLSSLFEWIGGINRYVYTIVFFAIIIALVLFNEKQDQKRASVLNQIEDDFENDNGESAFFEKVVDFNDGKDLAVTSSIFSFKNISYRLLLNKASNNKVNRLHKAYYYNTKYYVNRSDSLIAVDYNTPNKTIKIKTPPGYPSNRPVQAQPFPVVNMQYYGAYLNSGDTTVLYYDATSGFNKNYLSSKTYDALSNDALARTTTTLDYYIKYKGDELSYAIIQHGKGTSTKDTIFHVEIPEFDAISSIAQQYFQDTVNTLLAHGYKANRKKEVLLMGYNFKGIKTNPFWSFFPINDLSIEHDNYVIITDNNVLVHKTGPFSDTLKTLSKKLSGNNPVLKIYMLNVENALSSPLFMDLSNPDDGHRGNHIFSVLTKDTAYNIHEQSDGPNFNIINNTIVFYPENSDTLELYKSSIKNKPSTYHPLKQDSIFFRLLFSGRIACPTINPNGISFYFPDDATENFFVLSRTVDGKITAHYDSTTWKFKDFKDSIVYTVSYDVYYIIIFVCSVVIIYFTGLILISSSKINSIFNLNEIPLLNISAIDYKLRSIYTNMETLKNRSEWMLLLGVFFGVFGVLVSAFVFKMTNLDLKGGWTDPHTYVSLLKPMIILIFMETFTFYFLKQYRIIFNEYKLFYSVFLSNVNINILVNLKSIKGIADDTEMFATLKTKIASETFNLYETGTKNQIDEFDHKSLIDLVSSLKDLAKK